MKEMARREFYSLIQITSHPTSKLRMFKVARLSELIFRHSNKPSHVTISVNGFLSQEKNINIREFTMLASGVIVSY